MLLSSFSKVVFLDFEFRSPKGETIQAVHCLAALEMYSGQVWEFDAAELAALDANPLPTGDDVLYVGFAISAEWESFIALGWEIPKQVIDLRYEYCRWSNGNGELEKPPKGVGRTTLLWALRMLGISTTTDSAHKTQMRQLCIDNDVLPPSSKAAVMAYCLEDVRPLQPMLLKMLPTMGPTEQVLFRGRYAEIEAHCKRRGIPMDTETRNRLVENSKEYITKIAADCPVDIFLPSGQIGQRKFAAYLIPNEMPWPRTAGGLLAIDADTIKAALKDYPQLAPVYEVLRLNALLQDLSNLPVGTDGRCRYFQNVFGTITGRHAAFQNPFSMKRWMRFLIQPTEGKAFISADWKSQEIGIAGYLSNDENMIAVFNTAINGGDVYMRFAELSGLVPEGARREDYELMRSRAKVTFLSANYGSSAEGIAAKLNVSNGEGRRLLSKYRYTFRTYLEWVAGIQNYAFQMGEMTTNLGWRRYVTREPLRRNELPNGRSIANFPTQAAGADCMRVAAILAHDRGLQVLGTVHDSIMIEADSDDVERSADLLTQCMQEATENVLGMPSGVDICSAVYPFRYRDKDGEADWERACEIFSIVDDEEKFSKKHKADADDS